MSIFKEIAMEIAEGEICPHCLEEILHEVFAMGYEECKQDIVEALSEEEGKKEEEEEHIYIIER